MEVIEIALFIFRYSFAPRKAQQELSPGELLLDKTCKLCQHRFLSSVRENVRH